MADEDFLKHIQARNFTVKIKLDTAGRKGKSVTILDGLPKSELFLKDLLKALKKSCGVGGTYLMDKRDGILELQGDQRDRARTFLAKYAIKTN